MEANDEWQLQHHYTQMEGIAEPASGNQASGPHGLRIWWRARIFPHDRAFRRILSSSTVYPAGKQLLLTIGRAGVLSSPAVAAGELETLLGLLGPLSERQRSDLKRATDIVLVEDGALNYWPRTGEQFHIADAAYAMARVQATLAS